MTGTEIIERVRLTRARRAMIDALRKEIAG